MPRREVRSGDVIYTVEDPPLPGFDPFYERSILDPDDFSTHLQVVGSRYRSETCLSCGVTEPIRTFPTYLDRYRPNDARNGYYHQDHLSWCEDCDAWYLNGCPIDHSEYDDDDDNGCTCAACSSSRSPDIHSYSYRPRPRFHGRGTKTFLGMELEVETGGDWTTPNRTRHLAGEAVEALGDLAYLKEDGSVDGFEIVTHPMTFMYAMESFPWGLLPKLAEGGADANDACGLHVHVSRDTFDGPAHVYKWLKLIYRNEREVQRLARRHDSDWASFGDAHSRKAHKDYAKGGSSTRRYQAVNVQNSDTFEVRVFASSLNPDDVKAALAFVDASVEYTRQLTSNDVLKRDGWTWQAFMNWLPEKYDVLRKVTV